MRAGISKIKISDFSVCISYIFGEVYRAFCLTVNGLGVIICMRRRGCRLKAAAAYINLL